MIKKEKPNNIKDCKECNGEPITSELNLPEFEGVKCEDCYLILSYRKKQKPNEVPPTENL